MTTKSTIRSPKAGLIASSRSSRHRVSSRHRAHRAIVFHRVVELLASWRSSRHRVSSRHRAHRVIALIAPSRFIASSRSSRHRVSSPSTDQFWGDRAAWIVDPAGHVWTVAARIEETTEEERQARLSRIHKESTISEK